MPDTFVYVGTMAIKPGKVEEAKKAIAELVDFVETNEPRLIAFNAFIDEEAGKLAIVQVHPDPASMEFHLEVVAKHFTTAFDYLDKVESEQYYGSISPTLAKELAKWEGPDTSVTHIPVHEGGFTRTNIR